MTRATLLILLAALAIAATVRPSPSQSPSDGRTFPEWSPTAFPRPAAASDPSELSPVLTSTPVQEAGAITTGGADSGFQSASSADLPSSATLDIALFALPTPALRPLASDCRLPCYGIARRGPASYYTDPRYGPNGYYAAIPGYVGGVMSVAVCTFPEGQANCATFPVIDSCQCYRHTPAEIVVDLSPAAFVQFQPDLRRGIVMVTVTVLR